MGTAVACSMSSRLLVNMFKQNIRQDMSGLPSSPSTGPSLSDIPMQDFLEGNLAICDQGGGISEQVIIGGSRYVVQADGCTSERRHLGSAMQ